MSVLPSFLLLCPLDYLSPYHSSTLSVPLLPLPHAFGRRLPWCVLTEADGANAGLTIIVLGEHSEIMLGRRPQTVGKAVVIDCKNVSSSHCAIRRIQSLAAGAGPVGAGGGGVGGVAAVLVDLSTYGTFLNGQKVSEQDSPPPPPMAAHTAGQDLLASTTGAPPRPAAAAAGRPSQKPRWAELRNGDRIALLMRKLATGQDVPERVYTVALYGQAESAPAL
jgi:hypothetical protein